jgi:hypothetical protein
MRDVSRTRLVNPRGEALADRDAIGRQYELGGGGGGGARRQTCDRVADWVPDIDQRIGHGEEITRGGSAKEYGQDLMPLAHLAAQLNDGGATGYQALMSNERDTQEREKDAAHCQRNQQLGQCAPCTHRE